MIFIGITIYLVIIILSILSSNSISVFWNFQSLFIVIGGIISVLVATKSFKYIIYSIKIVTNNKLQVDKEKLGICIDLYKLLFLLTLANGAIGFVIGFINTFANLSDPATIGPTMAFSLVSILYGLIIAFLIILPLKFILCKKQKS